MAVANLLYLQSFNMISRHLRLNYGNGELGTIRTHFHFTYQGVFVLEGMRGSMAFLPIFYGQAEKDMSLIG